MFQNYDIEGEHLRCKLCGRLIRKGLFYMVRHNMECEEMKANIRQRTKQEQLDIIDASIDKALDERDFSQLEFLQWTREYIENKKLLTRGK